MAAQEADRYTLLKTHFNDIPERLLAIHSLGLQWFCVRSNTGASEVDIYVFFDKAGLSNYLEGVYAPVADNIRRILESHKIDDSLVPGDALREIEELLNY